MCGIVTSHVGSFGHDHVITRCARPHVGPEKLKPNDAD